MSNFLKKFQVIFIDDIPRELSFKREKDNYSLDIIPTSSPPNKHTN